MHNKFDFNSVTDFDRHISLSIPNYTGLYEIFRAISLDYMPPEGCCVDIGCSTGKFLNDLSSCTEGNYIGIDLVDMGQEKNFEFIQEDISTVLENTLIECEPPDLIICMFTLQFLGKHKREFVLKALKEFIDQGSVLLIAEKVYCNSAKLNSIMTKEHYNQKRKHFSDRDILDKDYSLLGKMFSADYSQMQEELNYLGMSEQVWQSYNFHGWMVS